MMPDNDENCLEPIETTISISRPLHCAICARPARYYHFNVQACEGCAFFFKRSIAKREYICSRTGNCGIKRVLECRACRFDKCILAGMELKGVKFPPGFDLATAKKRLELRKRSLFKNDKRNEAKNISANPAAIMRLPKDFSLEQHQIIADLTDVERRHRRIRESSSTFLSANQFVEKCIDHFLNYQANIFASAERFSDKPIDHIRPEFREALYTGKVAFDGQPVYLQSDIFLAIELAKTMPTFDKLDSADKKALVSHISIASMILSLGFYAFEKGQHTTVYPNGMMPIMLGKDQFENGKNAGVNKLRKRIYCDVIECFHRIGLTQEEMLLLRAIIYSHITTPNLSMSAQRILLKEAEKYSKILLNRCQQRLGDLGGARRYAEVVQFIEFIFRNAQHHREFVTTMFAFLQMPRVGYPLPPKMPKFVLECMNGCTLPMIQPINI